MFGLPDPSSLFGGGGSSTEVGGGGAGSQGSGAGSFNKSQRTSNINAPVGTQGSGNAVYANGNVTVTDNAAIADAFNFASHVSDLSAKVNQAGMAELQNGTSAILAKQTVDSGTQITSLVTTALYAAAAIAAAYFIWGK